MRFASSGAEKLRNIFVVAGLLLVAKLASAADVEGDLQPVPEQTPATTQASDGYQDDTSVFTDDECADYCGLTICSPPGRIWLRADYLIWWTNGMELPPLVTTSPAGTPVEDAGVLPAATVLYGNQTVGNDGRSGYRTTIGAWLDCCHIWNVEFDYLSLGERSHGYSATSTGNPILARPIYNVQRNAPGSELVAYPGVVEGTVSAETKEYFQSAGALLSYQLCSCDMCCGSCDSGCDPCGSYSVPTLNCCRTDFLFGFRYYNLSDRVDIREDLREISPEATYDIHDSFAANNNFYGSELGLRTQVYRGRWSLEVLTKVAIGNTHQEVAIAGSTAISATGQPTETYDDGILAGPSNEGVYTSDNFTVIPQFGFELGYQLTCTARVYLGYNLIYWGCVKRAADQIDLFVDPRNWPPAQTALPFPAYPADNSSFWAQGINVGMELRY